MDKQNYDIAHRHEVEEAILGAFLIDNSYEIEEIAIKHNLQPSDFRGLHHKALYTAILATWKEGTKVDLITIGSHRPTEFKQNTPGSMAKDWDIENIEISQKVSSTVHIEHHIMKLKEYVICEYWNNVSDAIACINWNVVDPIQVSDNITTRYKDLFKRMSVGIKVNHGEKDYDEEMKDKIINQRAGISANITTGVPKIDEIFHGGMSNSELIILAGRPGMMKTTISLIIAWNVVKAGHKAVYFSIEMPKNQLKNKIISMQTGIDYDALKNGDLTDTQWNVVTEWNKRIDESGLTIISDLRNIDHIADKMRELSNEGMCDFVAIDYLQLITSNAKDLREGIVHITRLMKSLAKECYMPLMLLSQLNRNVESRVNKRPYLSDLKESGSIEEDADIVIMPYNDAYYASRADPPMTVAESERWLVEFNITKGRDIGTSSGSITNGLTINPITLTIKPYEQTFG